MKTLLSLVAGTLLFVSISTFSAPPTQAAEHKISTAGGMFKIKLDAAFDQDTKNLDLKFSNIILLKELTYQITYTSEGNEQIVYGEVKPYTNNDIERTLRLGDCSNGTCVYDKNIKDIEVDYMAEYYLLGEESITAKL